MPTRAPCQTIFFVGTLGAMRKLAIVTGLLLGACASEPSAAWVGVYDMQIDERAWPCGDPTAEPTENSAARTWTLERVDADTLRLPGRCPMQANVVTPTRAELVPSACDVVTDSGLRGHVEVLDGTVYTDGAAIWGEIVLEGSLETGECSRSTLEFSGLR